VILLTLDDISLSLADRLLLDKVQLQLSTGERVCLVGRNGAGKSTLFRVISGELAPDDGERWCRDGVRLSHLQQEVPGDDRRTVYETVAAGLGETGRLLAAYHDAAAHAQSGRRELNRLAELHQRIDACDGWRTGLRIETVLSRLGLPADATLEQCSGGTRRRVMLAQALVSDPDLLLLDEPTNHMDIAAITWLEEFLLGFRGALVFITHDRTLLGNLATRIVELDRGRLTSWPGSYAHFLRRKEELLEAEERANAKFDRKLAEEEKWIRQGIKARRTRNEGRVQRLEQMRRERAGRREREGRAAMQADAGESSAKLVVDLRDVCFGYGGEPLVRNFSTRVLRGDRVGIIGPNGCGKSTLLRLLLGELRPDSGSIVRGARLEIAYFDQHRALLDPEKSVRWNMSEGSDYVQVRGRPRHVIGYLRQFLFPPERIDAPVKTLSGGERNRLLLARVFTRSANMLVLDEPTNDLDVDTLELLEDLLADYEGTLLLVSHDRAFLDNVVTSTIVFEGPGRVEEYVGGYQDWLRQRPQSAAEPAPARAQENALPARAQPPSAARKLGYREQQELSLLPARIESLEAEQQDIESRLSDPEFYRGAGERIAGAVQRLEGLRAELAAAYSRWEELEGRRGGA
jgi:ATP-binding cassette subfamily F protein uup